MALPGPGGPRAASCFFPLPLEGSSGLTGGFLLFVDGCVDGERRSAGQPTHLGATARQPGAAMPSASSWPLAEM